MIKVNHWLILKADYSLFITKYEKKYLDTVNSKKEILE